MTAVDLQLGIGNTSTSGPGRGLRPVGNIALLQRGTCTFELKAENAADRGRTVRPVLPRGLRHVRHNNDHALDVNSDAIGFAILTYAYSTETVNGVPGRRVPGQGTSDLPALAGPWGTLVP